MALSLPTIRELELHRHPLPDRCPCGAAWMPGNLPWCSSDDAHPFNPLVPALRLVRRLALYWADNAVRGKKHLALALAAKVRTVHNIGVEIKADDVVTAIITDHERFRPNRLALQEERPGTGAPHRNAEVMYIVFSGRIDGLGVRLRRIHRSCGTVALSI